MPDAVTPLAPEEPPNASELVFFALCTVGAAPASYVLARKTWRRDWGSAVVEVPVAGGGAYRVGRVTERRQLPVPRSVAAAAFLSFFLAAAIPLVGYPFVFDLSRNAHLYPWWLDAVQGAGVFAVPIALVMGLLLRAHAARYASALVSLLAAGATLTATLLLPWSTQAPYGTYHLASMGALTATLAAYTLCLAGAAFALARKPAPLPEDDEAAPVAASPVRVAAEPETDDAEADIEERQRARR